MQERKYHIVKCSSCNVSISKRSDTLKSWSGCCRKCINKQVANRPDIKTKKSISAKEQLKKQGGIPNSGKGALKKNLHYNWKGGLPNCVDCGVELSLYTCKRCVKCTAKYKSGENHWNWKGGLSDENVKVRQSKEYKEWRKNVFKRDNWTCVKCDYRSTGNSDIRADHIKPFHLFPELRLDINNGRTLCIECDKVHGYNYHRDKNKFEVSRSIN